MGTTKRRPNLTANSEGNGRNGPPTERQLDEKQRQEEEQLLDQRLRETFGWVPEMFDAEAWTGAREFHRLNMLFPGKHIVFRDRWKGRGQKRQLLEVKALLVTDDPVEAQDYLAELSKTIPQHEQPYYGLDYIEPPIVLTPRHRKPKKSKGGH